jgi:hypothetical protein
MDRACMIGSWDSHSSSVAPARPKPSISRRRRLVYLGLVYPLGFAACFLIAEVAFRLFWNPKYWVHTNRLPVGSGQTEAGKKWWPDTLYAVDSSEFRLSFRTNGQGYRARPDPIDVSHPYRIAFVGDSFTEGMQVPYECTFCSRLEAALNNDAPPRPVVCENFGISATDLLDYWHRIVHDVIPVNPPDALVLCIYPGNDFQCVFPDDAFGAGDTPLRDYFRRPDWVQHCKAWINLHSKAGCYLQRTLLTIGATKPPWLSQGPKFWWSDPELARQAHLAPAVRRSRAICQAIDQECRRNHVTLCVLVVGPVPTYCATDGQSPLAQILADWQIDVPVIDVAIKAVARPDHAQLTFPIDGHLTDMGHAYLAQEAAPSLRAVLTGPGLAFRRERPTSTDDRIGLRPVR